MPVLNEEAMLPATLDSLRQQTRPADRIVVTDGGSTDATRSVAERYGVTFLSSPQQGRGSQIAYALRNVHEDVVVVAHADMEFPRDSLESIAATMAANPDCPGGCLGHRFRRRRWCYRIVELLDANRAGRRGISFGDQAQFFRPAELMRHGGFPDQSIMEDLELSLRMKRLGRPVYLDRPVTVSSRYLDQHGYLLTICRNVVLRWVYRRRGVAACQTIYERYYQRNGIDR